LFNRALGNAHAVMNLHASTVDALHRAYKLIEGTLDQQAALWSYVDDFRYLALVCFATVPIGFALKRIRRGRTVAAH
jgi:MFS transporter, DHA2 family, multidrug resistance protein